MPKSAVSELQNEIEADLERSELPGVSWALLEGGEIVHRAAVGRVEAGRSDEVTPQTLFQACSISKPVAAFAMLRLVDRGLLDLDEDVNNRLTSWKIPERRWQPVVTLRQLVSRSAGLTVRGLPRLQPRCRSTDAWAGTRRRSPGEHRRSSRRLDPGTQFRYSGGGTVVMAAGWW